MESRGGLALALTHPVESMSNNHGGRRDSNHARIYAKWRNLPAYKSLSLKAKNLLESLLWEYRPSHANIWHATDAAVALRLDCSLPTAGRAVRELIEKGWLREERAGGLSGPRSQRSRYVSLSQYPTAARPAQPWRYEKWPEHGNDNVKTFDAVHVKK